VLKLLQNVNMKYEVLCGLLNSTISNDLQWPLTWVSQYFSEVNTSKMLHFRDSYYRMLIENHRQDIKWYQYGMSKTVQDRATVLVNVNSK